jgi:hypothetical protein
MAEAPAKTEEDNDVFDKLSGTQKSAILMMLLFFRMKRRLSVQSNRQT